MNEIEQSSYTYLLNVIRNKKELSVDELKYLYEIDNSIDINSYKEEFLLKAIKKKRDIKKDLSLVYGCKDFEVGIENPLEEISDNIVIYYGNLNSGNVENKEFLSSLKLVIGNINFNNEEEVSYLSNLEVIKGNANFKNLKSASGLEHLKIIEESANFDSLCSSYGLEKLEYIGKDAYFPLLIDSRGFKSLKNIGENALFLILEDTLGFEKLEYVGKDAYFPMVKDIDVLRHLYVGEEFIHNDKEEKRLILKKTV